MKAHVYTAAILQIKHRLFYLITIELIHTPYMHINNNIQLY
jgi:hypothetical protein